MFWKSFRLPDGKRRYFYADENTVLRITGKNWFNKATMGITVYRGYETEEYGTEPISEMIYHISIDYQILNYFGDKNGFHFRSKEYILVKNKFFKQDKGNGIEVTRMTKELKGILEEL